MLFNSSLFLQFFVAFLLLYWVVRNSLPARNLLIVAASYAFYAAWDFRFLSLLVLSSLVDFFAGRALHRLSAQGPRKALLALSLFFNLGLLGFFKYFDFFASSLGDLFLQLGLPFKTQTLGVILPVGISFYTFQTMGYTIDIYRRQTAPAENLVNFLAYVSFFPQLVAGPIERAGHLLPQFSRTLQITLPMLREGLWLGVWGMFKKVVLADNLAPLVEMAYTHPAPGGPLVVLGTVAFALQIYCDFSGYSDIARGSAKLLGFDLMVNFDIPYSASSLREFWRRWHISLSTWLRDYLYIPLGGGRLGLSRTCLNLFITMVLGGFWHGAKWTFLLWGAWHGLGLVVHRLWRLRFPSPRADSPWSFSGWLITVAFVLFGWLLFRADSLRHVGLLLAQFGQWQIPVWFPTYCVSLGLLSLPLLAMELWQRSRSNLLAPLALPSWAFASLNGLCLICILIFWEKLKTPFIYFQF